MLAYASRRMPASRPHRCTHDSTSRRRSLRIVEPRYNRPRLSMQQTALAFRDTEDFVRGVSPLRELGAYEWLWTQKGATFKTLANKFRAHPDKLPSDFVPPEIADATAAEVRSVLAERGVPHFGVHLRHDYEYPQALRD